MQFLVYLRLDCFFCLHFDLFCQNKGGRLDNIATKSRTEITVTACSLVRLCLQPSTCSLIVIVFNYLVNMTLYRHAVYNHIWTAFEISSHLFNVLLVFFLWDLLSFSTQSSNCKPFLGCFHLLISSSPLSKRTDGPSKLRYASHFCTIKNNLLY